MSTSILVRRLSPTVFTASFYGYTYGSFGGTIAEALGALVAGHAEELGLLIVGPDAPPAGEESTTTSLPEHGG